MKTNQNLAALSQFSFRYVYNHLSTDIYQLHFPNMLKPVIYHDYLIFQIAMYQTLSVLANHDGNVAKQKI